MSAHWDAYRRARNSVVHMIRNAKRAFYRDAIKSNLDNPKNLWKIIRNITPSKCSNLPRHLSVDGKIVSNNTEIANLFNQHFANITSSVDLGDAPVCPNWDYFTNFVNSKLPCGTAPFSIPPITEDFVLSSLNRLPLNKAAGLDGIDGYFLKIAAPAISSSLTSVFNLSLTCGVFPDVWKIAKVSPLFKEGSLLDRSNFRPISVLAIVSKILERHVHSNFYDFLASYDLLTDFQFGFRWFRSCEFAVMNLSDCILANMDRGLLSGLLLIDLKKAFDLVNHSTLLFKLGVYGCSPSALKWFNSYLTGRSQKTSFKGALSDSLPMSVGIPQGSILGPLFFLVFINDLPLYLSSTFDTNLTMFADDTTILTSGSTVQEVELRLNLLASDVSSWANLNRMALNASKTKSILIASPQKLRFLSSQSLDVAVNNTIVDQVLEAKVLGVTFDHHLSWEQHVDNLCCKLNSRLSLLRRISSFLTQEGSLHYYNACVHSQLVYCSSAWGTCSQTLLLRLLRVQKHAARIILGADFSTPSVALFSKLQWIPVNEMIKCRKLQLLFSIMANPEAPLCLKQKFSFLSTTRTTRITRGTTSHNLVIPQPRTNLGKRTFSYSATVLFNALEVDLKILAAHPLASPSALSSFSFSLKHKLRGLFLQNLNTVSHLEELCCHECRFLLKCRCFF